jgi:bifunctional non-homologous end joining protein LigD
VSRAAARHITAAPVRLPNAKRSPFPSFIEPCLATLLTEIPKDPDLIHEIKLDGYRTQAHVNDGNVTLYTRRGHDWTDAFGTIAAALCDLRARQVVLDGEVAVFDEYGVSDFHRLQEDLARGRDDRLVYSVFDLLYLEGFDLRRTPLIKRKEELAKLLRSLPRAHVRLSDHLEGGGNVVFEQACSMRLEGIISKKRNSPYRSGRQKSWSKTKCTKSDSYPIIAFVEKLGAQPRRIASLYIGRRHGDRLLYAGKARSGYTDAIARDIRERLDPFIRKSSPLSSPIKKPKATWVEPVLHAEVKFSGITADGLLREAVFKGIRGDLAAPPTTRAPRKTARSRGSAVTGARIPKENILQLLPDAVAPSQESLMNYWRKVHKRALDHLGHRPLKLVRHVHGTTFYHKGPLPPIPGSVHQLKLQKREGGEGIRLWVDDLEGLLGLVEMGAVELHPWNSTVEDIERPDIVVFDLDPGEGVGWDFVIESALNLRELVRAEGHDSWPKVTGGKGLHVMVPVERDMTHDAARGYCREIARRLAATDPAHYTLSAATSERRHRVFIDYLRNGRGTTAIGTYSPRARPGIPIAAPVTWAQVKAGIRSDAFSIATPFRRRKDDSELSP